MPAHIVGIHGLAYKPVKDVLARYWDSSIRDGLSLNCNKQNPAYGFEMVYWADLLYACPLHRKRRYHFDSLYNTEPYRKPRKGWPQEYEDGWRDDAFKLAGQAGGALLNKLDRHFGMDALSKFVISNILRDLDFYYDEKRMILDRADRNRLARRVLMDEVKGAILAARSRAGTLIVVAHSMGSIMAYDVLREIGRADPDFAVDHFVTIGSPLGLPTVKNNVYDANEGRAEADRVRTPTVVRASWLNYADRKDPVSFDNHLSDDYGGNRHGVKVRDDIVLNDYVGEKGGRNPHKSYGYLRTPEFSKFLSNHV